MKRFISFSLFLICGLFAVQQSRPVTSEETNGDESPLTLEIIHEIPHDIITFVRQGNYYYATDQNNLLVIDAHDPTYPQVVGTLPGVSGYSIAVAGDYVYVDAGFRTLIIVDVSTPELPIVVTSYNNFEPEDGVYPVIWDVAAYEQTLYVALDYYANQCPLLGKVAILDMSDPASPVRVGEGGHSSGGGAEIEIEGDMMYQLLMDNIFIYDVSAPGTMEIINVIGLDPGYHHNFGSIILDDQLALLSFSDGAYPCPGPGSHQGWFVVDVSNPFALEPEYLVYKPDISGSPTAYEDSYLFTLKSGKLEIFAFPNIEEPILSEIDIHKTSMDITDGMLTFIPEFGMTQTHRFATARLSTVSATVSPTLTSTLTFTDTNGLTEVLLPSGAVEHPAEVSILPLPAPDNPPEDLWLKQAFDIRGHFPAQQQTLYEFQQPLTATLPFTADSAAYPLGWQFLYWNETKWEDAAETCADTSPAAPPIVEGDNLQVSFCLTGKYGLFVPYYDLYQPIIHR